MRSAVCPCLVLALIAGPAHAQTAPGQPEATLTLGIKQVDEGNFQAALFTLDAVARRLVLEPAMHATDLSQAYLYRGVALVGLGQEEGAKGSFAAALQYDKTLRIGEDRFPPRVVRVFEAARLGKTKSVLLPPSGAAKKAGIGAGAVAAIVGGVLAAGGAAVAAASGAKPNTPPSAGGITISSDSPGTPIAGVSTVHFTATANDPDGDTLTFTWNFGDGGSATGSAVDHVYQNPSAVGQPWHVALTVDDGHGGTVTASTTVAVATLSGVWVWDDSGIRGGIIVTLQQSGGSITMEFHCQLKSCLGSGTGSVTASRAFTLQSRDVCDFGETDFQGTVDSSVSTISGSLTCRQTGFTATFHFQRMN